MACCNKITDNEKRSCLNHQKIMMCYTANLRLCNQGLFKVGSFYDFEDFIHGKDYLFSTVFDVELNEYKLNGNS